MRSIAVGIILLLSSTCIVYAESEIPTDENIRKQQVTKMVLCHNLSREIDGLLTLMIRYAGMPKEYEYAAQVRPMTEIWNNYCRE